MKKIFLPLLLSLSVFSYAQTKLVGPLTSSGIKEGGAVFSLNPSAPSASIIHSFDNLAPHRPTAGVAAGDGNWLYGMLTFNGTSNSGALYKIQRDGTGFTVLKNLSFATSTIPYYHSDGFIYFIDGPVIKKLNTTTNAVTNVGGSVSVKDLLIDDDDWIYYGNGVAISKIKTDGSLEQTLHIFNSATEGSNGFAGLTEVPGDSLVGVQTYEGSFNGGTLYSIKKDGTGFTVLHQFALASGIYPESKLQYFDGKLFGTTSQGGDFNNGVLFIINCDGTGYRILHHFAASAAGSIAGNISITSNARIFGTFSQFYGSFPAYRLFKVDTSGMNYEPFLQVAQREQGHLNKDLLIVDDETIFLATSEMGKHDGGVLNQSDTSGYVTGLFHFGYAANGFRPTALIKGTDTKLYGTTKIGGVEGAGIIFSMNQNGTGYSKLHELIEAEGYDPIGKLLEASDGKLYGVCQLGGPGNSGSIYRINKDGTGFQILYTFPDVAGGYNPAGNLIEDNSGSLYGMTKYSFPGSGVVFRINRDGSNYTVLHVFNIATDLAFPSGGLAVSGNNLFGVATRGGTQGKGGIFTIQKNGTSYQKLHEFNGIDGDQPSATPIIANNGKLYGTTDYGGNHSEGVVYSIETNGSNFAVLKHFSNSTDGSNPIGGIIQASDGLIYGTTGSSNIAGDFGGVVYKMNLDGSSFTLLYSFDLETEGQQPTTLIDLNAGTILPVQLISFTAQRKDQQVLLSWKTTAEINSDRFEVERSADGNSFKKMGTIKASGNVSQLTNYSFTDDHPLTGTSYYRLKEIDIDGAISYSKVLAMQFDRSSDVFISPNPATNQLIIKFKDGSTRFVASIFDASGKLVLKKTIWATDNDLNIQSLSRGWYVLKLNMGQTNETRFQFIKE